MTALRSVLMAGAIAIALAGSVAAYLSVRDVTYRVDRLERIAIGQQRINGDVDNQLRRLNSRP